MRGSKSVDERQLAVLVRALEEFITVYDRFIFGRALGELAGRHGKMKALDTAS
jgi:hypothetical protein